MTDLGRRVAAEALGTALLLAAVVGSGIMAERLTSDVALQLLCNALATGAALFVLIVMLAPVSGAHFNPAVTVSAALAGEVPPRSAAAYVLAQLAGAVIGVAVAHLMFSAPILELGVKPRSGPGQWLSEAIATFGLILTIRMLDRRALETTAAAVALYIVSAYWFTASTSFANPAVTLARSLTATFSGIRPFDVPAFILAQLAGAALAVRVVRWFLRRP